MKNDEPHHPRCLVCDYDLSGQTVNRCPECGLPLAASFQDPTPWAAAHHHAAQWWATCLAIVLWNRRVRVRTSLIPVTRHSRVFALSCLLIASVLIQAANMEVTYTHGGRTWSGFIYAAAEIVLGAFIHAALLATWLFIVSRGLRGKWHGAVSYTPACVHYSMVWFPVTALALVIAATTGIFSIGGGFLYLVLAVLAVAGGSFWLAWLWTSISESERIPWVAFRLLALAALIMVALAQFAMHGAELQQMVWDAIISPIRTGTVAAPSTLSLPTNVAP